MNKCDKCGYEHYDFEKCLDTFFFKHEHYGEEWQKIGAFDAEQEAEKVGEMLNEEDPQEGEIITRIPIANAHKGEIEYFDVSASLVWEYYAQESEQ